jgi:hypothetical protein
MFQVLAMIFLVISYAAALFATHSQSKLIRLNSNRVAELEDRVVELEMQVARIKSNRFIS